MGKMLGLVCASALSASALAGVTATGVTWEQVPETSQVRVDYTLPLGGDPVVVTLDVLTNGVSIGAANITRLAGDVNKLVAADGVQKHIFWRPDYDWADHVFKQGELTVNVVASPRDNPPDYLAIDLALGTANYYTCAEAVPFGVTNILYKGEVLLMRRIHSAGKTFTMGTPAAEVGRTLGWVDSTHLDETAHPVGFTSDYYIGVFELTLAQAYAVGALTTASSVTSSTRYLPYSQTWNTFRGGTWPGGDPNGSSVCQYLRTRTGFAIDLPTEAQWEFAARAGTYGGLCNGEEIPSSQYAKGTDQPMSAFGHTAALLPSGQYYNVAVGGFLPNGWGLYDVHGNACEWCLDLVNTDPLSTDFVQDPVGLSSGGTMRATRGGYGVYWANQARCGARGGRDPSGHNNFMGARVACPALAVK